MVRNLSSVDLVICIKVTTSSKLQIYLLCKVFLMIFFVYVFFFLIYLTYFIVCDDAKIQAIKEVVFAHQFLTKTYFSFRIVVSGSLVKLLKLNFCCSSSQLLTLSVLAHSGGCNSFSLSQESGIKHG